MGGKKGFLSFINVFNGSTLFFLMIRPLSALVLGKEVVEAGYGYTDLNLFYTIFLIFMIQNSVNFLYHFFSSISIRFSAFDIGLFRYRSYYFSSIFIFLAIAAGVKFLFESLLVMDEMILSANYFSFAENEWDHFKYFFLSKYFLIISLALYSSEKRCLYISALIALFSLGFIFIGLRGYTFAYVALFVFIVFSIKGVKLSILLLVFILTPAIGGVVLEYRLGFKVFESIADVYLLFFYQQSASFEVVYGVVGYWSQLLDCIDYYQYLNGLVEFGVCVDRSRGVFFESGGYGTSYYAEIIYFPVLGFFIVLITAMLLSILDHLRERFLWSLVNGRSFEIFLVSILLTLPNVVYIARSDALDFISKAFSVLAIVALASLMGELLVKGKNLNKSQDATSVY